MKTKKLNFFTAIFLSILFVLFNSCSNPFNGGNGKGSVSIILDSSIIKNSRAVYAEEDADNPDEITEEAEPDYFYSLIITGDFETGMEGEIYKNKPAVIKVDDIAPKSVINIELMIFSNRGVQLYKGSKEGIVIASGPNVIDLTLHSEDVSISTPIILWNCAEGELLVSESEDKQGLGYFYDNGSYYGNETKKLTVGAQLFDEVNENSSVVNSILPEGAVTKCFCFDPLTGDLYIFAEYEDETGSDFQFHIFKYEAADNYSTQTDLGGLYEYATNSIKNMVYLDGKIYCLGSDDNTGSIYVLKEGTEEYEEGGDTIFNLSSSISVSLDYNNTIDAALSEIIPSGTNYTSITTDGTYLYASFTGSAGNDGYKVGILKLTEGSESTNDNPSFDIEAYSFLFDNSNFKTTYGLTAADNPSSCSSFYITDMQVIGDTIYGLLLESSGFYYCRGGLIKIKMTADGFTMDKINNQYVLGWYEPEYETTQNGTYAINLYKGSYINPLNDTRTGLNNVFYGPRRFIALKPDVLYIADEGAYCDGSNYKRTSNRVLKIDLKNSAALTSVNADVTLCGYMPYSSYRYY